MRIYVLIICIFEKNKISDAAALRPGVPKKCR